MNKQIFAIVGTDTEIGKTYSCVKLAGYLIASGKNVACLKPVASGIVLTDMGYINHDSYLHCQAGIAGLTMEQITPFLFEQPVAPHLAAKLESKQLTVNLILERLSTIMDACNAEVVLIEGIGGVMVPLNYQETWLDLLAKLNIPVILVVGMKLGCLNHALLTSEVLRQRGINLAGFIANQIDREMLYLTENVQTLIQMLPCPILGDIAYQGGFKPSAIFEEVFE